MLDEERTESQGGEGTEEEPGKVSGESGVEESSDSSTDDDEEYDKDRALSTIRAQRESEKKAKDEARKEKAEKEKLQKQLDKLTKGEQTRVEKLEEQLKERDEKIQGLESSVSSMASQVRKSNFVESVGLPNPRVAYGLVASGEAGVEVEWDENNRPTNLKQVRKALREQFGEQFGDGSADGGKHGRDEQPKSMTALIRQAAGRET